MRKKYRVYQVDMSLVPDTRVPFPAYFVRYKSKTDQRMFVAYHAEQWVTYQHRRNSLGAVMVDIDDTLIDGNENVLHGFQYMKNIYEHIQTLFPAPRRDRASGRGPRACHASARGPRVLHPARPSAHAADGTLQGSDYSYVETFKWNTYLKIGREHNGVVARFGDKLWDVAAHESLTGYLAHVDDRDCYVFMDPAQKGTASLNSRVRETRSFFFRAHTLKLRYAEKADHRGRGREHVDQEHSQK